MCTRAVSALAHMLEERGVPTAVIALILPQVEKIRPPRAVMTPFPLGRPLGEPNNAAFQHRVLQHALGLLERGDGPVILEHFADDAPSAFDQSDWVPAVCLPRLPVPRASHEWTAALIAEIALISPAWELFKARFRRTTVGLSGQSVDRWPSFMTSFMDGDTPTLPLHDVPAVALRFVADDLKALYGEAVQAGGDPPSGRQIDDWFWRETMAGQFLIALSARAVESPDKTMRLVGGRFLVPRPYLA
jgi:hypothetical protein